MKPRIALFRGIVVVQILAITALLVLIYGKSNMRLASIAPIDRANMQFEQSRSFRNFFEPLAIDGGRIEESNIQASWLKSNPRYAVNSEGMNNTEEFSIEKPANTFRIAVLGDSWVWGFLVDTEANFSSRLANLLNEHESCETTEFEVLNLGVPSYDLAYAVERFRNRGMKFDPDLVVWMIRDDDFSEPNEFLVDRMEKRKSEIQASGEIPVMVKKRVGIDDIKYVHDPDGEPLFASPELNIAVAARLQAVDDLRAEWGVRGFMTYGARQLSAFSSAYSGDLLIIRNPKMGGGADVHAAVEDVVGQYVSQRARTYLKYLNADLAAEDALLPEFHPNEKGHDIIAREILDYLESEQLITCKSS